MTKESIIDKIDITHWPINGIDNPIYCKGNAGNGFRKGGL